MHDLAHLPPATGRTRRATRSDRESVLAADAAGLLELVRPGAELLVASSFSKNFSLYDERVGALSIVGASREEAVTLLSHLPNARSELT